jgi:energy-coupling factor transport system permease protein
MQSSYSPGISLLHRLHPLTKLAAVALLLVLLYILPGEWGSLLLFAFVLILAFTVILPLAFSLFLIQGILFPPADATPIPLGPITLTREGLLFAYITSARLLAMSAIVLLLLRTTHPADLVYALTQRGLPRSIGYILLVTLQIIPDMSARATAILEAQRSRGLETQRGFLRFRGLVPLISPLVVGALVDVEERAMALESRAYTAPGPKTSLRQLFDSPAQRVVRVLLLLSILALIAWRIAQYFM